MRVMSFAIASFFVLAAALAQNEPQLPPRPAEPRTSATATPMSVFDRMQLALETGWISPHVRGELPGKFEEHRDVPDGAALTRLDALIASPQSPFRAVLNARDVGQLDQRLAFELSRVGRLRADVVWDRVPHFLSNSQTLFRNTALGVLEVDPSTRASFQAILDAQPPANTPPAFYDLVRSTLAAAPSVSVATQRDVLTARSTFQPVKGFELHAQTSDTRRTGIVPLGMGTFSRFNVLTPPTNIPCASRAPNEACDGVWESIATELPAPVDYRTTTANAGVQWNGAKWTLGADYDVSRLRSAFDAITYDNPFRITDAQANPPGSGNGRNRFVRQQTAVEPDNDDQRVSVRGSLDLPRHTQFQALFATGRSTQNVQFLAYTLNTALQVKRVGGSANLPADFNPRDPAFLPEQSLHGNIRIQQQDYSIVSRPIARNTFRLELRDENQQNHTPAVVFPGMARFGDSDWVTSNDYYGNELRNFPRSFRRTDYNASWRWDALRNLTIESGYEGQVWRRTFRDVARTTENGARVRLDFRPTRTVTLNTTLHYADRTADNYEVLPFIFNTTTNAWEIPRNPDNSPNYHFKAGVSLEPPILRRYDETDRVRKDGAATLGFQLGERTTLSVGSAYRRDDYNRDMLGLNFEQHQTYSAGVTVNATDNILLFGDASHDRSRFTMRGIGHLIEAAVNGVTACCAQYPLANTWIRRNRATLDSITAGAGFTAPDQRTIIDLSYAHSLGKDQTHSFNPFPVLSISPRTATAYDYPDTHNRFHEAIVSVTRAIGRGIDLRLQYRRESFNIDDYYLNNMSTYPQGAIAPGGVPALLPRQIFLNARYGNYTANEGSIFVLYHINTPAKETTPR